MKGYMFLSLAIITEVFGTTMLKLSEGFTVILPGVGVVIAFGFSFYFLGLALHELPLSTAYAIWAGAGTALTAIVGIIVFSESVSILKAIALLLIIGGVVLLNKAKSDQALAEEIVI